MSVVLPLSLLRVIIVRLDFLGRDFSLVGYCCIIVLFPSIINIFQDDDY